MKQLHLLRTFKRSAYAGGLLLLLCTGTLFADATTEIQITATVNPVCIISGTPAGSMNIQPLMQSSQDFAGPAITVTCTSGMSGQTISIEGGLYDESVGGSAFALSNGSGDFIGYNVYRDSGRQNIWGDEVSGNTVTAIADGAEHTYNMYVRVPSGQNTVPSGHYTDTLTIKVSY